MAVELDGSSLSLCEILKREGLADDSVLRRSLLLAMSSRRLHGEVLVRDFHVSAAVVNLALRRQALARLATLERVADARVAFRVATRLPAFALCDTPLGPQEFLLGRRRARERAREPFDAGDRGSEARRPGGFTPDPRAWQVLGVPPGTNRLELKRAYRRLARLVHPDLHPGATEAERRALETRFIELTDAYRKLGA